MKIPGFVKIMLGLLLVLALTACQSEMVPDSPMSRSDGDETVDVAQAEIPSAQDTPETKPLQPLTDERFAGEDRRVFQADTRGRLGRLVVTVAYSEEKGTVQVDVWDPEDAQTPLQTITGNAEYAPPEMLADDDINFDGHPDIHFGTGYFEYLYLLWDEEAGRFIQTDQLNDLRAPIFDQVRQIVVDEEFGLYTTSNIYRWVEGKLKLMRRLTMEYGRDVEGLSALCQAEYYLPDYNPNGLSRYWLLTVEDRSEYGQMREVYMEVLDSCNGTMTEENSFDPQWYDLDYNGRS